MEKGRKEYLDKLKAESAKELGLNIKDTKSLTSRQAGSIGGLMVKKIVEQYKNA